MNIHAITPGVKIPRNILRIHDDYYSRHSIVFSQIKNYELNYCILSVVRWRGTFPVSCTDILTRYVPAVFYCNNNEIDVIAYGLIDFES